MKFDVTINTDDGYVQHAMALLCSLFENNKSHEIIVHVLTGNLSRDKEDAINALAMRYNSKCLFYHIDNSLLEGVKFRKNRPLSYAAYYRLLLSSVLDTGISRVLYLDCDMIVLDDVSSIFSLEIDDYALAATIDNTPCDDNHRKQLHMQVGDLTFCSGIMLINLNYWRKHQVEPKLLEYAKRDRERVYYHDQDALNYVFKHKWFVLPPKWNKYAYSNWLSKDICFRDYDRYEYMKKPIVIHYAALNIKPWLDCLSCNRNVYLKYLRMSGYQPVVFKHVSWSMKFKAFLNMVAYKYDIFVKPYLPKLIIIIIEDLKFIIKIMVLVLTGRIKNFTLLRDQE